MTNRALADFRHWFDQFCASAERLDWGVAEWCILAGKVDEFRREAAGRERSPYSRSLGSGLPVMQEQPRRSGYGWVTFREGEPIIVDPAEIATT